MRIPFVFGAIMCALALGMFVQDASAQVINTGIIVNGSFEADALPDAPGYTATITGWVASGNNAIINDAAGPFYDAAANGPIPLGDKVSGMQGAGTISQTLAGLQDGLEYQLQFYANGRNCCPGDNPAVMSLRVRLGTEVLYEIDPVELTPAFQFIQHTFVYDQAWGNDFELEFFDSTGDATIMIDGVGLFVDASSFPAPPGGVPVAGPIGLAALLMGIAAGGAMAARRRRK